MLVEVASFPIEAKQDVALYQSSAQDYRGRGCIDNARQWESCNAIGNESNAVLFCYFRVHFNKEER